MGFLNWSDIILILVLSFSWIPIYLLFRYIIIPIIDWVMGVHKSKEERDKEFE